MDARLLMGLALVLVSVVLGARLVSAARHTEPLVVVRHSLAAGTRLERGDLAVARVHLPAAQRELYLRDPSEAVGRQLVQPVTEGQLVPGTGVRAPDAAATVVIPLAADSGPRLAAGQRIRIWVATPSCSPRVLLDDVPVQSVRSGDNGSFTSSGGQAVTVAVAPQLAGRVIDALAIDKSVLRAARLAGAVEPAPGLPDLAPCRPPAR
jgi:hypothetical protein